MRNKWVHSLGQWLPHKWLIRFSYIKLYIFFSSECIWILIVPLKKKTWHFKAQQENRAIAAIEEREAQRRVSPVSNIRHWLVSPFIFMWMFSHFPTLPPWRLIKELRSGKMAELTIFETIFYIYLTFKQELEKAG